MPEWEALLLFVVYLSLRWIRSTKEFSTIVFATAIMSLVRSIAVRHGHMMFRLYLWQNLCCGVNCEFSDYELCGFTQYVFGLTSLVSIVLFPIYLTAAPFFVVYSRSAKIIGSNRAKLGWTVYYCMSFFDPFIRKIRGLPQKDQECIGANCFNCKYHTSCRKLKETVKRSGPLTFVLLLLLFLFFIPVFILLTVLLFIGHLILYVSLFLGSYLFVLFIVSAEIVTAVLKLDLTKNYYEKVLAIFLLLPFIQILYYYGFRYLIECGLSYMKRRKFNGEKSVQLVDLFYAVPISIEQTAIKLHDISKKNFYGKAIRQYHRLNISVKEDDEEKFSLEFIDIV